MELRSGSKLPPFVGPVRKGRSRGKSTAFSSSPITRLPSIPAHSTGISPRAQSEPQGDDTIYSDAPDNKERSICTEPPVQGFSDHPLVTLPSRREGGHLDPQDDRTSPRAARRSTKGFYGTRSQTRLRPPSARLIGRGLSGPKTLTASSQGSSSTAKHHLQGLPTIGSAFVASNDASGDTSKKPNPSKESNVVGPTSSPSNPTLPYGSPSFGEPMKGLTPTMETTAPSKTRPEDGPESSPIEAEHLSTSPLRPIRAPAEGPVEGSPRKAERLMSDESIPCSVPTIACSNQFPPCQYGYSISHIYHEGKGEADERKPRQDLRLVAPLQCPRPARSRGSEPSHCQGGPYQDLSNRSNPVYNGDQVNDIYNAGDHAETGGHQPGGGVGIGGGGYLTGGGIDGFPNGDGGGYDGYSRDTKMYSNKVAMTSTYPSGRGLHGPVEYGDQPSYARGHDLQGQAYRNGKSTYDDPGAVSPGDSGGDPTYPSSMGVNHPISSSNEIYPPSVFTMGRLPEPTPAATYHPSSSVRAPPVTINPNSQHLPPVGNAVYYGTSMGHAGPQSYYCSPNEQLPMNPATMGLGPHLASAPAGTTDSRHGAQYYNIDSCRPRHQALHQRDMREDQSPVSNHPRQQPSCSSRDDGPHTDRSRRSSRRHRDRRHQRDHSSSSRRRTPSSSRGSSHSRSSSSYHGGHGKPTRGATSRLRPRSKTYRTEEFYVPAKRSIAGYHSKCPGCHHKPCASRILDKDFDSASNNATKRSSKSIFIGNDDDRSGSTF